MNQLNTVPRGILPFFGISASGGDIAQILANLNESVDKFKAAQEERIKALEQGLDAKPSNDKISALGTQIESLQDELEKVSANVVAGQLNAGGAPVDAEATEAFMAYMRSGSEVSASLKTDPDTDGGYLAPREWDRTITDKLVEVSPLRSLFRVQTTSRSKYSKLYNLHGANSGWVGETEEREETNTPKFKSLDFDVGEIYANPAATQNILDDAEISLESWLASEVESEFSIQENKAFISGDGVKKPFGLLTYAEGAANAGRHPLGAIEVVASGDANKITTDSLIDLTDALPQTFGQQAAFMMNRKTRNHVRKLKDSEGNYIWQPSLQQGVPPTLLGYPVHIIADMPDVAANSLPIAFGDFNRAYVIIDRVGVRVLRDPYTKKPYVQFYTTKRVGGGVDNPEAIKLLKITTESGE